MSEKVQTPEQVQTQVDKFTDGIKASLGKNPTKPFKFNEFWVRSLQMQRLVVAGTPVLHQEDMGNLYSALGKNQVVWDGVVGEVRKTVKHSRERGNPSDLTRKVRAALDIAVALGMNQPSDDPKLKATGEFVRLMIGKYGVGDMSPEGVRIDEPGSDRGRNRLWSWIGRAVHRKKESAGEQISAARQLKPKSWVEVEKDGQVKGEWTAFDVNSGLDGFEVTEVGSEWKICYQGADKPVKKGSHLRLGKTDKEEAQRRIAAGENPDKVIGDLAQKYSKITDWDQLTATAATPTAVPEAVDQSHLGGGSEATPKVSDPDVGGPPVEQPAAAETNPDLSTPEKVEAWFKAREKLRKAPPSIIGDDQQLRAWDGAWSNACSASMSLKWLLKENIGPEGIIMYLFYGFKSVTKAAQKAGLDSNLDTTIQQISAKLGVHYEKAKKAWLADTDFSRLDQCLCEVQRLIKSETTSAEEESIVPPFLAEVRELFVQKIAEVIHNDQSHLGGGSEATLRVSSPDAGGQAEEAAVEHKIAGLEGFPELSREIEVVENLRRNTGLSWDERAAQIDVILGQMADQVLAQGIFNDNKALEVIGYTFGDIGLLALHQKIQALIDQEPKKYNAEIVGKWDSYLQKNKELREMDVILAGLSEGAKVDSSGRRVRQVVTSRRKARFTNPAHPYRTQEGVLRAEARAVQAEEALRRERERAVVTNGATPDNSQIRETLGNLIDRLAHGEPITSLSAEDQRRLYELLGQRMAELTHVAQAQRMSTEQVNNLTLFNDVMAALQTLAAGKGVPADVLTRLNGEAAKLIPQIADMIHPGASVSSADTQVPVEAKQEPVLSGQQLKDLQEPIKVRNKTFKFAEALEKLEDPAFLGGPDILAEIFLRLGFDLSRANSLPDAFEDVKAWCDELRLLAVALNKAVHPDTGAEDPILGTFATKLMGLASNEPIMRAVAGKLTKRAKAVVS